MRKNKSAIFGIPVTITGTRICKAFVCTAGFGGCAALSVHGLVAGVVANFLNTLAGDGEGVVHRTAHPALFWTYEGLWLLITCLFLPSFFEGIVQFNPLRRIWKRVFIARRKKVQMRRAEAQVRSVEAGQWPEPPWVRYPRPADASSEAEMEYLMDMFMLLWPLLTIEARKAYLVRDPPPAGKWQDMMADSMNLKVMDFSPKQQKWFCSRYREVLAD